MLSWAQSPNLLPRLLQLSVQPAVLLLVDEQGDDDAVVEAEECVIVARCVREDGPDPLFPGHTDTRRQGRHTALAETALVWRLAETQSGDVIIKNLRMISLKQQFETFEKKTHIFHWLAVI